MRQTFLASSDNSDFILNFQLSLLCKIISFWNTRIILIYIYAANMATITMSTIIDLLFEKYIMMSGTLCPKI